jgi:hypothetical protein
MGLVAAFAARETFVSTEGIIYATGGDTDSATDTLQKAMQSPATTPAELDNLLRNQLMNTAGPLRGKPAHTWTVQSAIKPKKPASSPSPARRRWRAGTSTATMAGWFSEAIRG